MAAARWPYSRAAEQSGRGLKMGPHIIWTCTLCKATGTVDPANDVEVALEGVRRQHLLLSPTCENSRDFYGERFGLNEETKIFRARAIEKARALERMKEEDAELARMDDDGAPPADCAFVRT